ncbi:hypothetical protein DERF_002833, partial [Dermatophagoides farinae]
NGKNDQPGLWSISIGVICSLELLFVYFKRWIMPIIHTQAFGSSIYIDLNFRIVRIIHQKNSIENSIKNMFHCAKN